MYWVEIANLKTTPHFSIFMIMVQLRKELLLNSLNVFNFLIFEK